MLQQFSLPAVNHTYVVSIEK